jgi:hypothetical protein
MHSLTEDIDKVMAELVELSNRAKRLGAMDSYYAINRAWHELVNRNEKPAKP